eukprot:9687288-Heterocapsa_arctica.AAC.1
MRSSMPAWIASSQNTTLKPECVAQVGRESQAGMHSSSQNVKLKPECVAQGRICIAPECVA